MRYIFMKIKAHAKINLSLDVIKKRDDGYHELEMIMVPLTLCDIITIEKADTECFCCDDETLLIDETNTIVKAVRLMETCYGVKQKFHIHVEKHIPMQAGMAGGSADAAAVLKGIVTLMELSIPISELSMQSKSIGADVPFCVYETPAIVKGIGEKIQPISIGFDFEILLVKPSMGVPTGKAFSLIDFTTCEHPDAHQVEQALQKKDYEAFCKSLGNTLEQPAFLMVPEIKEIKQTLLAMGFDAVLMSGSGSTVFAITKDHELMKRAITQCTRSDYFVYQTRIIRS